MRVEIGGHPASADELRFAALSTYGHFTALQVRAGAVRGLDRHLRRLDTANRELFGRPLPGDLVRDHLRHALRGTPDAAVRIVVYQADSGQTHGADRHRIMVAVGPPAEPSARPVRLRSVRYLRPFAHLKHLGGFGQAHHAVLARARGYDDALLTGPTGMISESSVANIGFLDGDRIVWPEPPWLHGIAMQLIERELAPVGMPSDRRPVPLTDIGRYDAAFLANSRGVVPVSGVDDTPISVASPALADLAARYAAIPGQPV
nr:aminotransferase class IV [Micromonospora sp. DSM 115978]